MSKGRGCGYHVTSVMEAGDVSDKQRNRRLFSRSTPTEVVVPAYVEGPCLGSGSKVKYSHPDDCPRFGHTADKTPLKSYLCDFCGSWHVSSNPVGVWRKRHKGAA